MSLQEIETVEVKAVTVDFADNDVQEVSIQDLRKSLRMQLPQIGYQNGIFHADLLDKISDLLQEKGMDFKATPVYVNANKSKKMPGAYLSEELEEKHGKNAIEAWSFSRMITKFEIENKSDEESNTSLAIGYHQDGIQIAMGPNIRVCSNQCILGSGMYMATYGKEKMPDHKRVLEVISDWLTNFNTIREHDSEMMKQMKAIECSYDQAMTFIGHMTSFAVRRNKMKSIGDIPLSQAQVGTFTESYLKHHDKNPDSVRTLWDLYNIGTEMHKAGRTDMPIILSSNQSLGKFISKYYLSLS